MHRSLLNASSALVAAALTLNPLLAAAQTAPSPVVVAQPLQTPYNTTSSPYGQFFRNPAADPQTSQAQLIAALRKRVKYVFVLFQENRSFDHYFGTFPGANGLFSDGVNIRAPKDTPGFAQSTFDANGTPTTVIPFLIPPSFHPADLDDIDHGHARMAMKMDLPNGTGTPLMDKFALTEYQKYSVPGNNAAQQKAQGFSQLVMGYIDCNTIPFLWNYAARFTLFDNIFQTTVGPSTPNAIAMISGQSGETQYVKHTPKTFTNIPVTGDPIPFWGSVSDTGTPPTSSLRQPVDVTGENQAPSNVSQNLTFASLPLTLAGGNLATVTAQDVAPSTDLADVQQDVPYITSLGRQQVSWRWYEEGYDHEVTDPTAAATHSSYIGHHNGAQYFGYISNNPQMSQNLKGLGDFFTDIGSNNMPAGGGVIYVRGGYANIVQPQLVPAFNTTNFPGNAEAAVVQRNFKGDDDHPAYSDSEISEALVAREVNAIASSPYWGQSAIVITYDESEGDYDHVPPRILSFDPAGLPLSRGPRIPLILISPYGRSHATSREEGDHNSVVKLINAVFNLPPLADLLDELQARISGQAASYSQYGITQTNLGPHDDQTPGTGNLISGFDPNRLMGFAPPIPASYAMIDPAIVGSLPHYGGNGCQALNILPQDQVVGYTAAPPPYFNPRPSTFPH